MRIVVAVAIMAAVTAWFAWVAWFMHRRATYGEHHRTPPARVAAHHPLPIVDPTGLATEAWEKAWPLPTRHTHRDPTTGRYTQGANVSDRTSTHVGMDWPPMLSLEQITVELAKMSYRPGWSLSVYQDLHQGPTLRIVASVEDGYHPGTYIDLGIDARIPDIVTTAELLHRWTLWRLLEVESHECREYFRVDGELLRNPHAHYEQSTARAAL